MNKQPTIKQVASAAKVSTQTVSRVINNRPDVAIDTRRRVMATIEELGYNPSIVARRLKYGNAHTLGFILPDISNPLFGNAIKAAYNYIQNSEYKNYELLYYDTEGDPEREKKAIDSFISHQAEGIIIASTGSNLIVDHIRQLQRNLNIIIVAVDNKLGDLNIDLVTSDNFQGAYLLTTHLIDLGHKVIAVITGPVNESSSQERLSGYQTALIEHGIPLNEQIVRIGDWKNESGFSQTLQLIQGKPKPTAIFGFNNSMSMGALSALKSRDIQVPDDIALVSFDDVEYGDLLNPTLTATNTSWSELGRVAAKLLLDRISNRSPEQQQCIKLPIGIVIRESSGFKRELEQ